MPGDGHDSEVQATGPASHHGSDADQQTRRKGRRYGFACVPCKQRKVKCSGEQPACAGCRRKGSECIWPANARGTESQLLREANERIRQLECTLERQPGGRDSTHMSVGSSPQPHTTTGDVLGVPNTLAATPSEAARSKRSLDQSSFAQSANDALRPKRTRTRSHCETALSAGGDSSGSPRSVLNSRSTLDPNSEGQKSHDSRLLPSLWYQVGIGEDGEVTYNGPTSRFHAGALPDPDGRNQDEDEESDSSSNDAGEENQSGDAMQDAQEMPISQTPGETGHRAGLSKARSLANSTERLVYYGEPPPGHLATLRSHWTLMDSVWTPLIAAKPTMNGTGVDTKTGVALLDIYWTWLHPLHHLVYRPAFVMDLALGGPHCSDFLLLCIFALAARHLPTAEPGLELVSKMGEQYVSRARTLLLDEMAASTPSIPTIQGLLILGGRQCAMGASSQGWLYTGMAIRMMQDVGLHLDTTHLAGIVDKWTPTELEVRKRLYNAAYVWDKTLSLALGRPPTLIRRPYPAHEILDKYDDGRLWRPVHAEEVVDSFEPSPSWVTSTLCVFSSLHEITTDMLLLFSRKHDRKQFGEHVANLDRRFCQWYTGIPEGIKISQPAALSQSPPPHIVSLNLLYHTLHILLRRPFLGESRKGPQSSIHVEHCVNHSKSIHEIHTLYTKTFPHRLMTYQVSYCIYTAATVEALELKSASLSPEERSGAAARLTAAVRILQNEASHTPGSGKSLDTIRRLLTEGERPAARRRRHSSRQKRRLTNRSQQRDSNPARDSGTPNQHGQGMGTNETVFEEDEGSGSRPGPGPPTTNTEGSSELSMQTRDFAGNGNGIASANPMVAEQPLGLDTSSMGTYGASREVALAQGFDNVFYANASGWGLDLGFYGGTNTGAGFHPDAFSFVVAAHSEGPRMPVAAPTPPTTYFYPAPPGLASRNSWLAPVP